MSHFLITWKVLSSLIIFLTYGQSTWNIAIWVTLSGWTTWALDALQKKDRWVGVVRGNLCEKEFKSINGAFNHRLKFHNDELDELNIQNISESEKYFKGFSHSPHSHSLLSLTNQKTHSLPGCINYLSECVHWKWVCSLEVSVFIRSECDEYSV